MDGLGKIYYKNEDIFSGKFWQEKYYGTDRQKYDITEKRFRSGILKNKDDEVI